MSISRRDYMVLLFRLKQQGKRHGVEVEIPRMDADKVYASATLYLAESVTSDLEMLALCQNIREYTGLQSDAR